MSKWQLQVELMSCRLVKFNVSRLVGLRMRMTQEKQLRRNELLDSFRSDNYNQRMW
jgi:hypothetical protein